MNSIVNFNNRVVNEQENKKNIDVKGIKSVIANVIMTGV